MKPMKNEYKLGRALLMFLLCVALSPACSLLSPRVQEKVIVVHDTTSVHHRDTTYRRDSIYIREWMKGDTVFVEKYKDRYVFRDRCRDSISVREVHDTTKVEVKVEKELSWSQKAKIDLFHWTLLLLIGALVWIFRKPLLGLLK